MQITAQNVFRSVFVLLAIYVLVLAADLLKIFILALFLAFLAAPLCRFLQKGKHLRTRRGLAAALAFGILLFACGLTLWLLCSPLVRELRSFSAELPYFLQSLQRLLAATGQDVVVPLAQQFDLKERFEYILLFIEEFALDGASVILKFIQKITAFSFSAIGKFFDFIIIPVLAFYFLRDYDIMLHGFLKLFPIAKRQTARDFLFSLGKMLSDFLYGQALLCAAVGLCMFLGLSLLGVKYPLLLGFAAAVFEAVPVVGPFISAVPAIALALTVSFSLAGKTAFLCMFIQILENHLLAPRIMGQSLDLPPAVILLSLLLGGELFGIMGMFVSLPAAAGLKIVLEYFWNTEEV